MRERVRQLQKQAEAALRKILKVERSQTAVETRSRAAHDPDRIRSLLAHPSFQQPFLQLLDRYFSDSFDDLADYAFEVVDAIDSGATPVEADSPWKRRVQHDIEQILEQMEEAS